MAQGRKNGVLPHGNGCKLYPDCFTCPLPDCVWIQGKSIEVQKKLIKLEKPYFERVLSEVVRS